jgi:phosphoserine phosphatase
MKPLKALVVDIDGTLWSKNSWLELTKGLSADPKEHTKVFNDYVSGQISYKESKNQLIGLWENTNNANKAYINELVKGWELDPLSKKLVNLFKSNGYKTAIITSSFDLWAKEVSNRLKIEKHYYNTELRWDKNKELIDYDYDINQANKKLKQLESFCVEFNLKPEECLVLGDEENDTELFRTTGNGVLIGEDKSRALAKEAWLTYSDISSFLKSKKLESILA